MKYGTSKRHVEGVGVIETLKRGVEKMLADVRTNALGSGKGSERHQTRNERAVQ